MSHPTDTQVGAFIWDWELLDWRKLTQSDLVSINENTSTFAYDANNRVEYLGESEPGTSKASVGWRIKKFTYNASGLVTDIQWANGNNGFNYIWNNYASYSYS